MGLPRIWKYTTFSILREVHCFKCKPLFKTLTSISFYLWLNTIPCHIRLQKYSFTNVVIRSKEDKVVKNSKLTSIVTIFKTRLFTGLYKTESSGFVEFQIISYEQSTHTIYYTQKGWVKLLLLYFLLIVRPKYWSKYI